MVVEEEDLGLRREVGKVSELLMVGGQSRYYRESGGRIREAGVLDPRHPRVIANGRYEAVRQVQL